MLGAWCAIMTVMRTTLDIDDDILLAARHMGKAAGKSMGQIVSELARKALTASARPEDEGIDAETVCGFRPFPSRGVVVTNDDVNRIREELGI
jgi:hypothetical protein